MGRLANTSGKQARKAAELAGWRLRNVVGDHYHYAKPGNRQVTIPKHREIRTGTLHKIIKDLGLTVDEFLALRDS